MNIQELEDKIDETYSSLAGLQAQKARIERLIELETSKLDAYKHDLAQAIAALPASPNIEALEKSLQAADRLLQNEDT